MQVAPREYSYQFDGTDTVRLVNLDRHSRKATSIIEPQALQSLRAFSRMDRLYRNENLLQACNQQLLDLLASAAKAQTPVDATNLLTRYAFEVMVAVTTEGGTRAGFLEETPSTKRITQQLSDWKFYSVLYGSFLRYHPFIKSFLRAFHFHSQGQGALDPVMDVLGREQPSSTDAEPEPVGKENAFPIRDREARIALVLAGADPTITLILEVLKTVGQDQELQQQLSDEVSSADLAQPLSFSSLALNKAKMPLLHAALQRQMRSQKLTDIGLSYAVEAGGFRFGNVVVPEDNTVTVTSIDSNTNMLDVSSVEALEPGLAPELNRHLPAYNLWSYDHSLKDCQYLLVAKLMAQVLTHFKIVHSENGRMSFTTKDEESVGPTEENISSLSDSPIDNERVSAGVDSTLATDGSTTDTDRDSEGVPSYNPLSLTDMEILHENLGPQLTEKLFETFPTAKGSVFGKDIFKIGPILHSAARHNVHQAIEHIYGKGLKHMTDEEEIMYIAAKSTYMRDFKSKRGGRGGRGGRNNWRGRPRRSGDVHPWYKDTIAALRPSVSPTVPEASTASASSAPAQSQQIPVGPAAGSSSRPQPRVPTDVKWSGWADDEHKKRAEAKTLESYKLQREQQIAADAQATTAPKPTVRIKETFRQTVASSTGNNLAKPRQIVHNETTVHDADGSTTISGEGVMLPKDTVEATQPVAPRAADFVPPHKRAALERQRLADEAAASASTKKASSPLSPVATLFRPTTNVRSHLADPSIAPFVPGPSQRNVVFPPQSQVANGPGHLVQPTYEGVAVGTLGFFGFSPSGTVVPISASSSRVADHSIGVPATTAHLPGLGIDGPGYRADSPTQGTANSASVNSRVPTLVRSRGSLDLSTSSVSDAGSSASLWGILN